MRWRHVCPLPMRHEQARRPTTATASSIVDARAPAPTADAAPSRTRSRRLPVRSHRSAAHTTRGAGGEAEAVVEPLRQHAVQLRNERDDGRAGQGDAPHPARQLPRQEVGERHTDRAEQHVGQPQEQQTAVGPAQRVGEPHERRDQARS